ncbi:MAG: DUF99 family protein [Gammaproteobacteria bacterium]|jgi:endonuclease V-like protein UPF0215 family
MSGTTTHVIGFDDSPFPRDHRGDVVVVGAAFAALRLEGVLTGKVRRDGANATRTLIRLFSQSRFAAHGQLIMLQGIAFAGFNVIDIHALNEALAIPVLVVARRQPDLAAIKQALLCSVSGGKRKWRLIEEAGEMEQVAGVYIQRAGIGRTAARRVIEYFAVNSAIPEPLRTAHLIAAGLAGGHSRQRV